MIVFNIILANEEKAEDISLYLIKKKYALQVHIDTNKILKDKKQLQTVRLFFITKALLYNKIESEIKKEFFSKDIILYATPVSHINEEHGALLRSSLKSV
ncbi:MAG: hypothetical protein JNJ41_09745 [Bacteroidia bacterium]|nr:hypothetical protein [Bacteroidia bacterium]